MNECRVGTETGMSKPVYCTVQWTVHYTRLGVYCTLASLDACLSAM